MSSSGTFDLIPAELIRIIFSFMDVASLGRIAQTARNSLAEYASDNATWARLVERRFRISTKRSRPAVHGGHSWKQAYFSMSHSNRIPRSKYTGSRKVVFAKGRSSHRECNGQSSPVSLWVLMGHTENCKTRTIQQCETTRDNASNESNSNERFVELYLCMQNVKSGSGEVTVNVLDATLSMMGTSGLSSLMVSCVHNKGSSLQPKMLFSDTTITNDGTYFDLDITSGIKLRPFDIVIVSVHFPCAPDVFETDFLARAISVHVPIRSLNQTGTNKDDAKIPASLFAVSHNMEACAFFMPENDVWNYYMELPGNFLALVDRFQLAVA